MKNKTIIAGILGVLLTGIVFLGFEVNTLQAEVTQLSKMPDASNVQNPIMPKVVNVQQNQKPYNNPWNPYNELAQIHRQMNQLFNDAFSDSLWQQGIPVSNGFDLKSDIKDNKDKYIITMDIPGMEKDNINVEVKNKNLLVSGERNNQNEESGGNYYKQERSFGYFSQALPLPADANDSGISVAYDKGVLTIEVPKLAKGNAEEEQSTKIKVN